MPFQTLDEFTRAVDAAGYTSEQKGNIEVAWNVYQAAQKPANGLIVLGRLKFEQGSTEEAPGIDKAMLDNFGMANADSILRDRAGSILSEPHWTILVNDALILGGVHASVEFQFASPRTRENIYSEKDNRMTVTGREVAGLTAFGYEFRTIEAGKKEYNEVAQPKNVVTNASFENYGRAVSAYTDPQQPQWQDLVNPKAQAKVESSGGQERDQRERDQRERDQRERDQRERDQRERDQRERDQRERDQRERDQRERDRRK